MIQSPNCCLFCLYIIYENSIFFLVLLFIEVYLVLNVFWLFICVLKVNLINLVTDLKLMPNPIDKLLSLPHTSMQDKSVEEAEKGFSGKFCCWQVFVVFVVSVVFYWPLNSNM